MGTNRGDCCPERLMGVEIWLSTADAKHYKDGTRCSPGPDDAHQRGLQWKTGERRTVPCEGLANSIWLVLPGPSMRELTVCGVEVAATPQSRAPVAAAKATQTVQLRPRPRPRRQKQRKAQEDAD